ncbi:hypothetical protein JCM19000A_15720 [Silvimonas sp. JCM 19000]
MHWARIGEAGFVGGMKFMFALYRLCGRWPFRLALYPVLAWYVLTRAVARRASRDYLARLYLYSNGCTPRPGLLNVLRHFAAFAEALVDKVLAWSDPDRLGEVSVSGRQAVLDLLDAGRGGVFVVSHIGNFELCRAIARQRRQGIKLNIFVHTRHAERFNRVLHDLAPDSQLDLIQVSDFSPATAVMLAEKVERGEFIVIAGDRVPVSEQGPVLNVDFLGAPAPLPFGPYLLANMLRCPLISLMARREGARSVITIRVLADAVRLPRADRIGGATALAQAYAEQMAQACVAAPFQWFNFFDFWGSAPRGE